MERFLNWCITEKGRTVVSYIATGAIALTGSSHFLPHTLFVEYYVDFLHLYRKGLTVPISNETKEQFENILEILKVPPNQRPLYKPFNTVGFDALHIGCSFSRWGIRVGIPAIFRYKSEADVDKQLISVNKESVAWGTEVGQKLMKSLIISRSAQDYAIAREIKMGETPKVLIDSSLGFIFSFAAYSLSRSINTKFNFYAKPLLFRGVVYVLVGAFSVGNYFLMKDLTQLHYEESVDREIKENYPELAEGAKEYYTKLMLRNMCLRNLLGKDGENLFSPLGNPNHFIRIKTTPLMQRREFFE